MKRRTFITLSTMAASGLGVAAEDRKKPLYRVGIITDIHYTDQDSRGVRHYRESLVKLKAAVADLAGKDLETTFNLGDLVDKNIDSYPTILPVFEGLGHQVRHIMGNHDFSVKDELKETIPELLGIGKGYYSFEMGGHRWICLDTNEVSIYRWSKRDERTKLAKEKLKKMEEEKAQNAKSWNGSISQEQLQWLDQELKIADDKGTMAFVCGHHPFLPKMSNRAWDYEEVLDVFAKHPSMKAYFGGHEHSGALAEHEGVHLLTFQSMVDVPEKTSYAVLNLYPDKIEIEGFGKEPSRTLIFR